MEYYEQQSNRRQDWTPDHGYRNVDDLERSYPRRAFLSGANNAFVVAILTDKNDLNYACQDFSLQGMRVSSAEFCFNLTIRFCSRSSACGRDGI